MSGSQSSKTNSGATRSVERSITVSVPPEAVWNALTDAKELARWFAASAEVTPGVGGSITLHWPADLCGDWPMKIEVWQPGKRLTVEDRWPDMPDAGRDPRAQQHRLMIDYQIEARGGATTLRLVHSGFGPAGDAPWDTLYDGVRTGWNHELGSLRHYLEYHRGKDRDFICTHRKVAMPMARVWERLIGTGCLGAQKPVDQLKEGDAVELRTAIGATYKARVAAIQPGEAAAFDIPELNHAYLRVTTWTVSHAEGHREGEVRLNAYGVDSPTIASLRERWERAFDRLFPESITAAAAARA